MSFDLGFGKVPGDPAPWEGATVNAPAVPESSSAGDGPESDPVSEVRAAPADRILADPAQIGRLVDIMLADDEELADSLEKCDLDRTRLIEIAQDQHLEIGRSATPESEAMARAEALADSAERLEVKPRKLRANWLPNVYVAAFGAVAGAGLSAAAFVTRFTGADSSTVGLVAALAGGFAALLVLTRLGIDYVNAESAERAAKRNQRLDVAGARARLDAASKALDRALIAGGLRPAVLAIREQRVTPVYGTALHYVSARGLSEVYNADRFEVSTRGFAQIKQFLDSTPGGSIGLAGSRGTGKSTVIASFVSGRTRRSDGKRGLSVEVSAPVDYDPRDFLLHLFAEVCRAVFITEPAPGFFEAELAARMRRGASRFQAAIKMSAALILAAAAVLVLLSAEHYLHISGAEWLGFGLVLASTACAAWAYNPGGARRAERAEYRQLEGGIPVGMFGRGIAELAASNLAMIKFQQTYTKGWSGSLTATAGPLSATAGLNGGTSFEQNVLSLPDIVTKFQRFITEVTPVGPVIIGIDELDKIQSADRAQAFLNDIKSVFGVDQCYFLISISEEALASFERRGLPIRNAFDSALDDVARLTPLDYATARDLIRGRAVGLCEPYVALAYCLSGGLPRDMIRWTRAIVNASEPGAALTALTFQIIGADLKRKTQASVVALCDRAVPEAGAAIEYLGGLTPVADPAWLLARCMENLAAPQAAGGQPPAWLALMPRPRGDQVADDDASVLVRRLMTELFSYFYFCATVLEVFTDELHEATFRLLAEGDGDRGFGQLARARHLFGTDSRLAVKQISAFRVDRRLHGVLPDWPVPAPRPAMPAQPESAGETVPAPPVTDPVAS